MDALVYPRERTLGKLTLVLGLLGWNLLVVGTFGAALIYVLLAFVAYVFAQSAVIAWIKGTAVKLSPTQFPDLYRRFEEACRKLGITELPDVYLMNGSGALNAFATRFFGRNFVVLLSDVVDAMEAEPDGIGFYFGHELGHIRMNHLTGKLWRLPVLWLPLLGAAYSRAQEYTCDLHGLACCQAPSSAARALVALAAGARRWQTADLPSYAAQARSNSGFWGSFHELTGGYPWLSKRVARTLDPGAAPAPRNPLAYLLALFVPYGGRAGGGAVGFMVTIAMVGILAAVALPAYQDYQRRATVAMVWSQGAAVRDGLGRYYAERKEIPASLEEAGLPSALPDGSPMEFDADSMTVSVTSSAGVVLMQPEGGMDGQALKWHCEAGEGLKANALPAGCRAPRVR
ncbi:MAG: peptidase M48 [Comamonadaceae bacterium]|nr:MAG: peptidase M48 [Comamonadaceae bacterium]